MFEQSHSLLPSKDFDKYYPQLHFLYDYQKAAVEYFKKNNLKFVLYALPPGLGKTIVTIGILITTPFKKCVIICPVSLMINWQREIETHTKYTSQIIKSGKDKINDVDIIICSFALVSPDKMDCDILIIDESHYLKNRNTQRTKKVFKINTTYTIALTGTPIVNRPMDVFPILNKYSPETIGNMNYFKFGIKFCGGYKSRWGWDFSRATNLEELGLRLRKSCMYRITKKEALPQLPDRNVQIISLGNGSYTPKDFILKSVKNVEIDIPFEEIMKDRIETSKLKYFDVTQFIVDQLEYENKIVVFAHFKETIEYLTTALFDYGIVTLTGDQNLKQRQESIDLFQNNDKVRIFIGSLMASGVGITLTAANVAVFVESDWVPGNNEQALDRLHRIGQKNNVTGYFLAIKDSIEEYMLKTHMIKSRNIKKIMQ